MRNGDEAALRAFLAHLSPEARGQRFFTGAVDTDTVAHWAADTDSDRYGLLAHDENGVLVAHATYVLLDETCAEVAVEVADHLHSRGLGTILIERLAAIAEQRGIARFVAQVLSANSAMLDVFRDGFEAHVALREGVEMVEFPTSSWRVACERFDTGRCEEA